MFSLDEYFWFDVRRLKMFGWHCLNVVVAVFDVGAFVVFALVAVDVVVIFD